ncbi:MAG TPA: YfhO family protein [Drouetiella sp.]
MNQRRAIALVVIFYCAVSIGLLSPLLFFGKTPFLADITYNNEPAATFINNFWSHNNKFPLWNPWVLNGVPQIAVTWPMLYFPASLGLGMPYGLGWGLFMLLHLLVAGVGGFLWQLKSHRFEPANFMAAVFFGLGFMLCGYMFGCPINLLLMASASWIPFTLLALDMICSSPKWWQCGLLSLLLGLQFSAGRPEISVAACILYSVYFLSNLGSLRPRAPLMVVAAFAIAAGYASFGYIPLAELVVNSPASLQFSVLKSSYWSTGIVDWLTLLITQPFGYINMLSSGDVVTYPGSLPYVTSLFLGAPVLTLAALSLPRNWKHSAPWLLLILVSVLIAAGQFGPFGVFIDKQNILRYPIKLALFALFGLLVMAANGWRSVFSGSSTRSNVFSATIFWLMIIVAAAMVNANVQMLTDSHHVLIKGVMLAAVGGLITTVLLLLKNRSTEVILLAVVAASFVLNDKALLNPLAPSDHFEQKSKVAELINSHCQLGAQNFRILPLIDNSVVIPKSLALNSADLDEKFSAYCRQILRPNTSIDAHIQSSNGISVIPTWNSLFIDTGLMPRSTLTAIEHPLGKSDIPLYRYCQATSTAYVETLRETQNEDGTWTPVPILDKRFFEVLKEEPELNIRLYTIVHIRPRVSVIQNLKFLPSRNEALKYINRSDSNEYDPTHEVILVGAKPESRVESSNKVLSNYAEVEVDQNEYIKINANTGVPAALVLTDGYYPGWEAFDNGKPTNIFMADGVMRAVLLSPGEHRIVFRYRPISWFVGLLLFFASLTTAGFMLLSRFVKTNPSW